MEKHKNAFICITGLDGSGKTTLGRKLCGYLNDKNIDSIYVYARLRPFFSKPSMAIGHFLFLRNHDMEKDYTEYTRKKNILFKKNKFISNCYRMILFFDDIIQLIWKIKFPLLKGKTVICDRYVYDTVITDMANDMQMPSDQLDTILERYFLFLPKPTVTFLIDVDENVAHSRKNDIPNIKYLKDRRNLYLNVAERYNMNILNGNKEINEVFSEAKEKIIYVLNT